MAINKTVASPAAFPTFTKVKDNAVPVGFNGLIFSAPGVGKTTFASGFAEYGPMLLFDFDAGRESVLDVENLYLAEPPAVMEARERGEDVTDMDKKLTWKETRAYMDTALALKSASPYKTYAFDSLSALYYEQLIPHIVGSETKKVEWPHYAQAQRELTKFVRDAKSLCEYGINTIFTGHVKEESDGDITNVRFALPQGVRNEILLIVNHVGYLARAKNSETRELHFTPPRKVDGPKLRQTRSGKQAPLVFTDPTVGKLLDALKKAK